MSGMRVSALCSTSGRPAVPAVAQNARLVARQPQGLRWGHLAPDTTELPKRSVVTYAGRDSKTKSKQKKAVIPKKVKAKKIREPVVKEEAAKPAASNGASNGAAAANGAANGASASTNGAAAAGDAPAELVDLTAGDDSVSKMRSGASTVSSGIKLDGITKTFKGNELLKGVTWDVKKGQRVGLVGVNGAGKTTQLQIIMGNLDADSGEVLKARQNMNIAYLNQEFNIHPDMTVREELASAFAEGLQVMERTEAIQKELEQCTEDMDRMALLLDELDKLSNKIQDLDMATVDKKLDQMMPQLGFGPQDNDRKVREYSGGWQMRMCLGKILLQDPDLLLLDEPTNHLDLDAIEWLEGYIKGLDIPTVIVSHDREFLDQVCTKIVETERGKATAYSGNYTQYLVQKLQRAGQQQTAYDKWSKEVGKQKDIIRRLSAGGQSGRATSAEKALEKLQLDPQEKPFEERKRSFRFPAVENMGELAVEISGLTHGYNDRLLFKNVDLEIGKGERIAIIGPNGAGKSTLLRLIMGTEAPQEGEVRMGAHSIVPNYYQQNQSEALDLKLSVIETLQLAADEAKEDEIKALLGKMMFSKASFDKNVGVLSGGEKARLALAKFMLTKGTLLVLDEPTNHLDIPSKEMLEEAVKNFEGSVIAVSHDRYFLKQIATRITNVENNQLVDYSGDYEYYLEKNDVEAAKMAAKEEKMKVISDSTIKAKSNMSKAEKIAAKKARAKEFELQKAGTKKSGVKHRP